MLNILFLSSLHSKTCDNSFNTFPKFCKIFQGDPLVSDQQVQALANLVCGQGIHKSPPIHTCLDFNQAFLFQDPQSLPKGPPAGLEHFFQLPLGGQFVSSL